MIPGDPAPGPLEIFAAKVFDLDGTEGSTSVPTSTLLHRLLDDDFLPDPLLDEAIRVLARQPIASTSALVEQVDLAFEGRLHSLVEQFAEEFLTIPLPSRTQRYQTLLEACHGSPRLARRLEALTPGLKIDRSRKPDPSPAVEVLIGDLFALFPLAPEPRAAEARARRQRFRSDPSLTDRDRALTLKALARRHPDVVALWPDYPASLAQQRRPSLADRTRAKSRGLERFGPKQNRGIYIILGMILFAQVNKRWINPTPDLPKPVTILAARPSLDSPSKTFRPNRAPSPLQLEFRGMIDRRLVRAGIPVNDATLDRLLERLPFNELPDVDGMASILLGGQWTKAVHGRFVRNLRMGLQADVLGISAEQVEQVSEGAFPQAIEPDRKAVPSPP